MQTFLLRGRKEVKQMMPLAFYSLLAVPPVLAVMNLFWFWKIAKGMIKTLSKARHSHSHDLVVVI
ncbi:hypothetical protein CsSME_00041352 [Camellia sinensis var. sinensis]